ncbi:MAG: pilus assembly protein PilO [Nitrospinota bacterium]|nr:MAG: pilus assembly protein PilO [Nitrospinota bacterium]
MDELINRIDQLPGYQRWLLVGLVIVTILAGYYYFVYQGKSQRIRTLQREIAEMQRIRDEHQKIANTLDEFRSRVAALDQRFESVKILLPERREIPELLTQISKLGMQMGLEFNLFRPEPEVKRDFYAEVPVSLEVQGSFHNVARFFDAIGKLPRIVNVTNFLMGEPTVSGGEVRVRTRGTVVTFRFLDPRELREQQKAKKRRR